MLDYEKVDPSKYVYLPKLNEESEFKIKEVRVVDTGPDKFHFTQKEKIRVGDVLAEVDKNLGYHIECDLENDKVLSVTSLSAFLQVFRKYRINDGDHVIVTHIAKGEWKVVKLNAPDPVVEEFDKKETDLSQVSHEE